MTTSKETSTTLHGVFLDVFGVGVLLRGPSGIGKSEIALGLISRGHRLIADDAVTFQRDPTHDKIIGICPAVLCDFLEVRGLGVLNVRALYGDSAVKDSTTLQLIVQLIDVSDDIFRHSDRLFGIHNEHTLLGLPFKEVTIPVGPGRNISVLVEAAVRNHSIQLKGYNAAEDFAAIQRAFLEQKKNDEQPEAEEK